MEDNVLYFMIIINWSFSPNCRHSTYIYCTFLKEKSALNLMNWVCVVEFLSAWSLQSHAGVSQGFLVKIESMISFLFFKSRQRAAFQIPTVELDLSHLRCSAVTPTTSTCCLFFCTSYTWITGESSGFPPSLSVMPKGILGNVGRRKSIGKIITV